MASTDILQRPLDANSNRIPNLGTPTTAGDATYVDTVTVPLVESGSGSNGTSFLAARADHVHPAAGGGAGLTLTEVEVNMGSTPVYSGNFQITGLTGLTANKQVLIQQKAAPYTGKGTLYDESEMDQVLANGYVLNSTTIQAFWVSAHGNGPVAGNIKFGYAVSA
jgi:hypothetical protein